MGIEQNHHVTVQQEISQVNVCAPHVVIIGAGASRAACPSGDLHGQKVPLMADFMDVIPVRNVLDKAGIKYENRNFEEVYSDLASKPKYKLFLPELERIIYDYFARLELPDVPNIYDYLLLSLRQKDVVATFNWDPFLLQAARRLKIKKDSLPQILFLHGNVLAGYCENDKVCGVKGACCLKCGRPLSPSRLLYPISEKNYDDDPMIFASWQDLRNALNSAFMLTVFGYGAPVSDVSAINLLQNAWHYTGDVKLEQFEIIDILHERELRTKWENFYYKHYYEVHNNFFSSWIYLHPRRSGEAFRNQYCDGKFIENNPIPHNLSIPELKSWIEPLEEVEKMFDKDSLE